MPKFTSAGKTALGNVFLKGTTRPTLYLGLFANVMEPAATATMADIVEIATPGDYGYARRELSVGGWTEDPQGIYTHIEQSFTSNGGAWGSCYGYFITDAETGYAGDLFTVMRFPSGPYEIEDQRIFRFTPVMTRAPEYLYDGRINVYVTPTNVTVTSPPQGEGDIWYADSPSSSAIQAAIDNAQNGDTVIVPAGSATWNSNVTVPSTKGITVIAAGIGLTNINMGGSYQVLLDTRPNNSPVRWSGFSFTNGPSHAMQVNNMTIGATDFRIDHCSWTGFTAANCLYFSGFIAGVMDNCTITNCFRPFWFDGQVRPQDITIPYDYPGGYAWKQPLTPAGAVYVEDCDISNTASDIFFNCRGGARFVFRYNTVTGPIGLETHSGCTPGYRNDRWGEIYNNTFVTGGSYWCGAFLRSINGMYFNNTFSGYATMIRFDNETTCISCTQPPWPTANKTVYPAQDQIGAGIDTGYGTPQSTTEAKLRFWNNTLNAVQTSASNTACAMIAEDRDFWQQKTPFTGASGIGVGLLANRPSSGLTVGVCYWATDSGAQGTLYRATGATTWETLYTPYTYPHPVRGE